MGRQRGTLETLREALMEEKQLEFGHTTKCFAMLFSRSRSYAFPPEFRIGYSEILNVKKTLRRLEVLIQDDLRFGAQVKEMIRRANVTTWIIRRMKSVGVDQDTLVTGCYSLHFNPGRK